MVLDTSVIPKGEYCYSMSKSEISSLRDVVMCPYWKHRSEIDEAEYHDQNDGYCLFLGKGDIELNQENKYTLSYPKDHPDLGIPMTADEIGLPLSLLWDQVKECHENMMDDEELVSIELGEKE